ncbi:TIGR03943 family putative permease subunit [Fusibacter bizertensis]
MKSYKFNEQALLELVSTIIFSGTLIYLVISDRYLLYVTPRMKPYLVFAAIAMLLWSILGGNLRKPQYKVKTAHCFVLVIPVVFLLLPHSSLTGADIDINAVSSMSKGSGVSSTTSIGISKNTTIDSSKTTIRMDSYQPEGLDETNKRIEVANDNFYKWISEIYANAQKYKGYTIVMTGYVFKDPQYFKEGEFIPARLTMMCCSADLAPIGMLCRYNDVSSLEAGSWVTVEGIIEIENGDAGDEPVVHVTKVIHADEVEGYVYPF